MKRKPLKIVAGTYDANGYATATPTGFKELDPTDTFEASHVEQDATHRFATDAEKTAWNAKEPGNANIQAHIISAHAPANAQKNSDITQAEIEAKLVGAITTHSHSGGGAIVNKSVAAQTGFAADTYLTGSLLAFPSAPLVGTTYRLLFDVTKTAAGTAAIALNIRLGTAGAIADASRILFTFGAGTAAIDAGVIEVQAMFRVVGASAILQAWARLISNLTVTGLSNAVKARVVTSAAFDSTVANLKIGASYNGGASAAHTIQLVRAEIVL